MQDTSVMVLLAFRLWGNLEFSILPKDASICEEDELGIKLLSLQTIATVAMFKNMLFFFFLVPIVLDLLDLNLITFSLTKIWWNDMQHGEELHPLFTPCSIDT